MTTAGTAVVVLDAVGLVEVDVVVEDGTVDVVDEPAVVEVDAGAPVVLGAGETAGDVVVVVRRVVVVVVTGAGTAGTYRTGGAGSGRTHRYRAMAPANTTRRATVDRRSGPIMGRPAPAWR